ncbi:general stress protein [Neobacillus sp. MER 74]|uniref:general stress protein n=1 Tax=Neobacillus sp. MER 74 TaxID=2939566 RepID=UPI00203C7F16|nr:general stress protein [Neobacillus sp. MER 74]MCM3116126.1 general stress protein [Neobacillus sp. MER 74]
MRQVKLVENGLQAKQEIEQLLNQGFSKDEVYLLAHSKERSEDLAEELDTNEIGVNEQGFLDSIANVFRSRGDELRSKMESLGLSDTEAQQFEKELDKGRVVVVAAK